jgi:two-component system phosphate regulon sensor histidine kinase PhoR
VDRGQWPALDGIAAVRRLLRAGRGRLRRLRQRARRLASALGDFRAAATALPDGTLIISGEGALVWFNRAATRLLNLSYPGDLGRYLTHLVREPRVHDWLQARNTEPLLDLPAPSDAALRLSFRQVSYAAGLRLVVVRDITQMVRLEQVRRDFVANVSHELRTPLTVVNGYLDTIDDDEAPELAAIFSQMRAQSRRMVQIVEDLLTLSRLDASDRMADETVDMESSLRQLLRDGEGLSRGRHELQLEAPVLRRDLRGSAKDLRSAFSNLLSNAVRYTPDGGRIRLRWVAHPLGAAFEVCDSGIGIPAEHLPRLTERFYRVSNSRSRDNGGTGLGLAIVKHVLMLHQGHLEIESTPGQGSCFRAVLPMARLHEPAADP